MLRLVIPLLALGCAPKPVTDADLAAASQVASSWLDAIEASDCSAMLALSQTEVTRLECGLQVAMLKERYVHTTGVEVVRAADSGTIEVQTRAVEIGNSERILTLTLVRGGGDGWLVRL